MRHWSGLLLAAATLGASSASALYGYTVPPGSPGFQRGNSSQAIQFDSHSLFIDNKRVFIFGGEFHPWRLPSTCYALLRIDN
jgi:hypothetical protein